MNKFKICFLILIIILTILATGCWDMVEINERIFPYTAGIDNNYQSVDQKDKYIISFSYPNINALGNNPSSATKVFSVSTEASNIFEATNNLSNQIQEPIDLKHLKVLSISEDVAKDPNSIRQILDGINRDFVINKMVHLMVVKGSARELFNVKVKSQRQEAIDGSIYSILRNRQNSTRFTPKTINRFIRDMDTQGASHMPVGIAGNNEVIVSGAGVFKNYKLVGYLNEMENRDVAILNGDLVQDGLDTQYEDSNLSLLIANLKSKRKIITGDEDIKVIFNVQVEGQIHEFILDDNDKIDSDLIIKDMEKVLCKEMEKGLNKTIYKLQRELNADVIGILEHLYRFHPSLWEQVKDDWDSIFPQLDIKVNIDLNIRRRGLTT